ncbi:hypothetical protein CRUP_005080, partial [Coryphaenoides rupestris]
VHLLHRAVPHGRERGAADHLRRAALCAEDGPVLRHASQQVQLLLRLLHVPHAHHGVLHSPLPPALLPHVATEEESAGPRRRLQQIGVSKRASRQTNCQSSSRNGSGEQQTLQKKNNTENAQPTTENKSCEFTSES